MARFARDCMTAFANLVRKLEVNLGPDTGELELRIGKLAEYVFDRKSGNNVHNWTSSRIRHGRSALRAGDGWCFAWRACSLPTFRGYNE